MVQEGFTHFWRTATIKHLHLIGSLIFWRNIWIDQRVQRDRKHLCQCLQNQIGRIYLSYLMLAICLTDTWLRSASSCCVRSFFFRASRIFCPKAVKSSIGIITHLKYILSCRFAQRNNLIMLVDRFDYADFENIEYFHLWPWWSILLLRTFLKLCCFLKFCMLYCYTQQHNS